MAEELKVQNAKLREAIDALIKDRDYFAEKLDKMKQGEA